MGLINWNERILALAKKMNWLDFSLLKLSVFAFTLFLITAFPAFVNAVSLIAWYWWLAISMLAAAPLFRKMF